MKQVEQATGMGGAERKRMEAVIETLANLRSRGESLAELAHDARNMVTALGLYCDLLEEPGVLPFPYAHYGSELRLVAAASRSLVERMVALDGRTVAEADSTASGFAAMGRGSASASMPVPSADRGLEASRRWEILPAEPVDNLAVELAANRNLLCALAGPAIVLTMNAQGGDRPVRLTAEDLTRVLVNLVKNAAEAMPNAGSIQIALSERTAGDATAWLVLTIDDSGPGIPADSLERIFSSGYTTRSQTEVGSASPPATHRGLGLAITRSIVESAGGHIFAANRDKGGARFVIELPARKAVS